MSLLLSLLDSTSPVADYYSRLYSVQLLSAICAARPERLQECILSVPLGVSRLVSVLDDGRDAVRNAGLLLLVELTSNTNEDLRKIVAFEDVFGRLFGLVKLEGGLSEAGIVAQDCLTLMANLLRGSSSNQTIFRESGCVPQLIDLLSQSFPPSTPEADFLAQNREKAAWGVLQLLRLLFASGEPSTPQNQLAFHKGGAARILCDLGLDLNLPFPIRTCSFRVTAALIRDNSFVQEQFAGLQVKVKADAKPQQSQPPPGGNAREKNGVQGPGVRKSAEVPQTYIIEALLEICLRPLHADIPFRASACNLIQAYLAKHDRIKNHFLQRAIAGHEQNESAANVLTTLLRPPESDPSSAVFASWIVQDLVTGHEDAKASLRSVKEGDASEGEDEIMFVQALTSQLHTCLAQTPADEKLVTAHAALLTSLFWDFAPAVDDFLADGSSLVRAIVDNIKATDPSPIIAGLAAVLLGTIYEFSTKDSPIPRKTLAPILQQNLGRTKYLDAITNLRRHQTIRDYDLLAESDQSHESLLSGTFVDFFALEYARLRKAIDKDPGIEILPQSAAEAGVQRDVLDDLRQQVLAAKEALTTAQSSALQELQQAQERDVVAAKELKAANAELERVRKINQSIQQEHEKELAKIAQEHERNRLATEAQHQRALTDAKQEAERRRQEMSREHAAATAQMTQAHTTRLAELEKKSRAEIDGRAALQRQLDSLDATHKAILDREKSLVQQLGETEKKVLAATQESQSLRSQVADLEVELRTAKTALQSQTEAVENYKTRVEDLEQKLSDREEELETERAGFADLEKELETAKSDLSAAKAATSRSDKKSATQGELDETKQELKAAKEELESMLLVMSDIEAKRDVYRQRLVDLGGEVTDDDADEEEDDDDAEEEDNDDDVD